MKLIRNYFGENDNTPFQHLAFEVLDKIIKKSAQKDLKQQNKFAR